MDSIIDTLDTLAAQRTRWNAEVLAALAAPLVVEDEMDAPEGWDSGAITFDPYVG